MRLLILASFGLALVGQPATAQDSDTQWVRKARRSSCEWWETCRSKREYYYVRQRVNSYNNDQLRAYRSRDSDATCIDRTLSRVGEERYGRDRAKESAEQQWAEEVRSRYGVRYMDTRNARGITYECGRSSTGNRASEKTNEVVGRFLEQCVIEARPCRAEREGGEK